MMRTSSALLTLLSLGCATGAHAKKPPAATAEPSKELVALDNLSDSFRDLSQRISPSVVQILATGYAPLAHGGIGKRRSTGSGVIVSTEGHIITNAHVINGARRVEIRLDASLNDPGRSIIQRPSALVQATVVGFDLETDLALLKIEPKAELPAVPFGDSDELRAGQIVLAFGSPLGLAGSVTMGVVSHVARQLHYEDPMVYVQTDAPINPGNSGGPLIDTHGRLVGINTLILSKSGGSEGLGFSAPSNIVKAVYEQLRQTGHVRRGIIGAHAQTLDPVMAAGLGLARRGGVVLTDVFPGSPAYVAGLEPRDVILTLDGKPMENARQFLVNVYHSKIGGTIRLRILRGEKQETVEVMVVERNHTRERLAEPLDPEKNLIESLGILGVDVTGPIQAALPTLRKPGGVLVAAIPRDSHGVLVGDVIHRVNESSVRNLAELAAAMTKLQEGDPVVLELERRGRFVFVAFQLE